MTMPATLPSRKVAAHARSLLSSSARRFAVPTSRPECNRAIASVAVVRDLEPDVVPVSIECLAEPHMGGIRSAGLAFEEPR